MALNKLRSYGTKTSMLFYSLGFARSLADHNVYHCSDNILIQLNVDNTCMSYPEAAAKAVIEVKPKHSQRYNITNQDPTCQFLGIKIHRDGAGVNLSLKPISLQYSDDSTWSILMVYQYPWTPMYIWIWLKSRGRIHWKMSLTIKQSWKHQCTQHIQLGQLARMQLLLFLITLCSNSAAI